MDTEREEGYQSLPDTLHKTPDDATSEKEDGYQSLPDRLSRQNRDASPVYPLSRDTPPPADAAEAPATSPIGPPDSLNVAAPADVTNAPPAGAAPPPLAFPPP